MDKDVGGARALTKQASDVTEGAGTKFNLLDLFSGIGGFSLGLERSGAFKTVAFCEIDPFCRRVLAKHWPEVPCYDDVRSVTATRLAADGISVNAICGGFPCQDISVAGKGAGLDGARSGLWFEYARIIGELRPRVVVVENASALLNRGFGRVLGSLAALGFDAEWEIIPASVAGTEHHRARLWLVAYPQGIRCGWWRCLWPTAQSNEFAGLGEGELWGRRSQSKPVGVLDGVQNRVDRIRSLGNAVVPQIPELIGRAISRSTMGAVQ